MLPWEDKWGIGLDETLRDAVEQAVNRLRVIKEQEGPDVAMRQQARFLLSWTLVFKDMFGDFDTHAAVVGEETGRLLELMGVDRDSAIRGSKAGLSTLRHAIKRSMT